MQLLMKLPSRDIRLIGTARTASMVIRSGAPIRSLCAEGRLDLPGMSVRSDGS